MRIAILNTMAPFIKGGAEMLADNLAEQLETRGHDVDVFRIPFPNEYTVALIDLIMAVKMLNLDCFDRVICFKFPCYYINHKNKVIWFFHQFRQVYELYDGEYGLSGIENGDVIKKIIEALDAKEITAARHIYCIAEEVNKRLNKYNRLEAVVLNHALPDEKCYYCENSGDYIYYPSRIANLKRQQLAIESMEYTGSDVKLVIAGRYDEKDYYERLLLLIKEKHLENKVVIENRWVPEEEKLDMLANSLAVMYIPYFEDSCGFVTMEGFYSSKAVITCTDSGGTGEFVVNERNGFLVEPDPKELARVMDYLYENKDMSQALGRQARQDMIDKNINWDEITGRLLE